MFRASPDAYDRFIGRYGTELASALIEFASLEPGMRALDVGCRAGALAAVLRWSSGVLTLTETWMTYSPSLATRTAGGTTLAVAISTQGGPGTG